MKTVAFSVLFAIFSLTSFAQTDSTKANPIISAFLSMNASTLSQHFDVTSPLNFSVNDCVNELDYTPVETFSSSLKIAQKVLSSIKDEVGTNASLTWADCFSVSVFWKDTPIAIVFILTKSDGTRMKINAFCTPEFKIRDVTIYLDSCNHF